MRGALGRALVVEQLVDELSIGTSCMMCDTEKLKGAKISFIGRLLEVR